jgi:ribosomal protein S18 acetylase RimI-like enzyme
MNNTITLQPFTPDSPLFPGVTRAFKLTWPTRFLSLNDAADPIRRHATYGGFKGVAAVTSQREVVGFTYGYTDSPGQWWHEYIARVIGVAEADRQLTGSFCLTELAVLPQWRRQGLGRRLIHAILADLPHNHAVLSTQCDNATAIALYQSLGWFMIVERMLFNVAGPEYTILAYELPATRATYDHP